MHLVPNYLQIVDSEPKIPTRTDKKMHLLKQGAIYQVNKGSILTYRAYDQDLSGYHHQAFLEIKNSVETWQNSQNFKISKVNMFWRSGEMSAQISLESLTNKRGG